VLLEQNTMFQELILKNEEQQRKSEEEKMNYCEETRNSSPR